MEIALGLLVLVGWSVRQRAGRKLNISVPLLLVLAGVADPSSLRSAH